MSTLPEIAQMIQDCIGCESRLTEWEIRFVDSIDKQLSEGRGLSPKQDEQLCKTWERVTS